MKEIVLEYFGKMKQDVEIIIYVITVAPIIFVAIHPVLKKLFSFRTFATYYVITEFLVLEHVISFTTRSCSENGLCTAKQLCSVLHWDILCGCILIYVVPKIMSKKRGVEWIKNDILYYRSDKKKTKYFIFLSILQEIYEICLVSLLLYFVLMLWLCTYKEELEVSVIIFVILLLIHSVRIIDTYLSYQDYVQNGVYQEILDGYFYLFLKRGVEQGRSLQEILDNNCIKNQKLRSVIKDCSSKNQEQSIAEILIYIKIQIKNDQLFLKYVGFFEKTDFNIDMNNILKKIDKKVEEIIKKEIQTPEPPGFLIFKNLYKMKESLGGKFLK